MLPSVAIWHYIEIDLYQRLVWVARGVLQKWLGMNREISFFQRAKRKLRDSYRWGVPVLRPKILRTFQHDTAAFTQGLAYHNNRIYESTGLNNCSSLRCLDAVSGEVLQKIEIPNDWAEGLAIDDDCLIQLSWKRGIATLYSLEKFERIGCYLYAGEGWGLTHSMDGFIMTNGSNILQYRDKNFELKKIKAITHFGIKVKRLNDLVYVNNKIFVNRWYRDDILQVCAETGKIEAIIDCGELRSIAVPRHSDHVLNGITYQPDRGSFILTGKCWPLFFEVKLEVMDSI